MWWPSPNWYEGHLTAATTETGTVWAFAAGYVGEAPDAETFLLVANPSDTDAHVNFNLTRDQTGQFRCQQTVTVPAHSRLTRGIKDICPANYFINMLGKEFNVSGTVESDGPGIVVERSTYWSTPGQLWSAGASALLTKLQ